MNAPLPESIRKALESVSLDDKYRLDRGRAGHGSIGLVRLASGRVHAFEGGGGS